MNTPIAWQAPKHFPSLGHNEVHLWCAGLRQTPETVQTLRLGLAEDEIARAERFYFERHQCDFVVARGLLRKLLARYLERSAGELRFEYSSYGKPILVPEFQQPSKSKGLLNFNVSHAGDYVLYGIVLEHEIGVDIEYVKRDIECLQIAEGFFSAHEQAVLRSLSTAEEERQAFFNCWTRKEAYIKAHGEGLSLPLDQFDVTLDETAKLLATRPDAREAEQWQLHNLAPVPEYAAAVAIESGAWCFRKFGVSDVVGVGNVNHYG